MEDIEMKKWEKFSKEEIEQFVKEVIHIDSLELN